MSNTASSPVIAPDLTVTPLAELVSLRDRVVAITGGGSGIGRAVARRVAEAGATVAVVDRDADAANSSVQELVDAGSAADAHVVDVSDRDAVRGTVEQIVAAHGRLDAWVNVAGYLAISPMLEADDALVRGMLDVNLVGTLNGSVEAARHMAEHGGGVIVNTSSTTAHNVPAPGMVPYITSKGGIEALTRALAVELGPHGIRVVAIAPTMTSTPGFDRSGAAADPGQSDAYGERLPLGRIAVPDDIARVVLLILTDLASFITGSVVFADAGDVTL